MTLMLANVIDASEAELSPPASKLCAKPRRELNPRPEERQRRVSKDAERPALHRRAVNRPSRPLRGASGRGELENSQIPAASYRHSALAFAVHRPKPLAIMLRMTAQT
jgi:hypothetical protein